MREILQKKIRGRSESCQRQDRERHEQVHRLRRLHQLLPYQGVDAQQGAVLQGRPAGPHGQEEPEDGRGLHDIIAKTNVIREE